MPSTLADSGFAMRFFPHRTGMDPSRFVASHYFWNLYVLNRFAFVLMLILYATLFSSPHPLALHCILFRCVGTAPTTMDRYSDGHQRGPAFVGLLPNFVPHHGPAASDGVSTLRVSVVMLGSCGVCSRLRCRMCVVGASIPIRVDDRHRVVRPGGHVAWYDQNCMARKFQMIFAGWKTV